MLYNDGNTIVIIIVIDSVRDGNILYIGFL